MKYFPIALRLKAKDILVVGGGKIAERKVLSLLEAKAKVLVIAPLVTKRLKDLYGQGKIRLFSRGVRRTDIKNVTFIIAATDDKDTNKDVCGWARKLGIPVNVVDKTELCDFISVATLKIDKALISVYTDGLDPKLSRDLKKYLRSRWDDFISYRNKL
ncbi:MAG: bifunctional precorrin-2 dehydrogenase/sirohydrochlorin ferrochelatase [Candidatus Omnitrophota bacterium]